MCAYIEQYAATYKLYHGTTKEQSKLCYKDNVNELEVVRIDAGINNALCKKWKDELQ